MEGAPTPSGRRPWPAAVWLALVLAVGVAAGALLALTVPIPHGPPPPGSPPGAAPPPAWWDQVGVVLSTVSLALLLALLFVYVRTFRATRAPYTLGLVVFLGALFVESAVNSPLLFRAFGLGPGTLGRFLDVAGLLMCFALSVFLYLSLQ